MDVKTPPRVEVENRLWSTAIESAVAGGLALFCASILTRWAHIPTSTLLTALGVAAILAVMSVLMRTGSIALGVYAAAWCALIFTWCVWSRLGNPYTRVPLTGLVCAVFILGPAGAFAVARWNRQLDAIASAELARLDAATRRRYETVLANLNCPVAVTAVDEDRSGTLVHIALPSTGRVTLDHLRNVAAGAEVALKTKRGTIMFAGGSHAGEVVMKIRERDILAVPVPMPADYSPLTINQPVRVGVREDGTPHLVLFREKAALGVGQRGKGKSNLANVLISQFGRCIDVLIFVIDLKQGRMVRPWLAPWIFGLCQRPAVDWVATSRDEAAIMLSAMSAGIDARAYTGHGGEKLTPDRGHPAVLLVTDETAVIFGPGGPRVPWVAPLCGSLDPHPAHPSVKDGKTLVCAGVQATNRQLADVGTDIVNRGRSEAIDPVLFALRGVVDMMGGGHLKAQCDVRFGFGVADQAEASYLFTNAPSFSHKALAEMKEPGSGAVQSGSETPHILKYDRLEYERIEEIAVATSAYRPEPDPVLRAAWGDAWEDRWVRAMPFLDQIRNKPPAAASIALTVASDADRTRETFDAMMAKVEDPESKLDPRQVRMREIIAARGAQGTSPAWIRRCLKQDVEQGRFADLGEPARETVQRWLNADTGEGIIVKTRFGHYEPRHAHDLGPTP